MTVSSCGSGSAAMSVSSSTLTGSKSCSSADAGLGFMESVFVCVCECAYVCRRTVRRCIVPVHFVLFPSCDRETLNEPLLCSPLLCLRLLERYVAARRDTRPSSLSASLGCPVMVWLLCSTSVFLLEKHTDWMGTVTKTRLLCVCIDALSDTFSLPS